MTVEASTWSARWRALVDQNASSLGAGPLRSIFELLRVLADCDEQACRELSTAVWPAAARLAAAARPSFKTKFDVMSRELGESAPAFRALDEEAKARLDIAVLSFQATLSSLLAHERNDAEEELIKDFEPEASAILGAAHAIMDNGADGGSACASFVAMDWFCQALLAVADARVSPVRLEWRARFSAIAAVSASLRQLAQTLRVQSQAEPLSAQALVEFSLAKAFENARCVRLRVDEQLGELSGGVVMAVRSGALREFALSPTGRTVFVGPVVAGEVRGYPAAIEGRRFTARIDSEVLIVQRVAFEAIVRDDPLMLRSLTAQFAASTSYLTERVYELAVLDVRARLVSELLRLARLGQRDGDVVTIVNAPSHSVLAETVGVAREVVTRELSALARADIIAVARRSITVRNFSKLQDMAPDVLWRRDSPADIH